MTENKPESASTEQPHAPAAGTSSFHRLAPQTSPLSLLASRAFGPLFGAQFFSAFNDNFLKITIALLITGMASVHPAMTASTAGPLSSAGALNSLAAAVFMLPFLLFSATAGELADRFDKAQLARFYKLLEVGAAAVAALGLLLASLPMLMTALFFFGTGSAFFGPVKYAVLPEQITSSELPRANAWVESATFIAILAGSVVADLSYSGPETRPYITALLMMVFSGLCFLCTLFMPYAGPAKADLRVSANIVASTGRLLGLLGKQRKLLIVSLMLSWFWMIGAVVVPMLPLIGKVLGSYAHSTSFFLVVFSLAVAAGSALAAWMSAGRIVLLQSVFGCFVCGLALMDCGFAIGGADTSLRAVSFGDFLALPGTLRITLDLIIAAVGAALIAVPGFAALQAWSRPEERARIIAANNILNSVLMIAGAVIVAFLQNGGLPGMALFKGFSLTGVLETLGISCLIAALAMLKFLPTAPLRDFVSILFRAFFRLEVKGMEHLAEGGKTPILAFNHVSFLDGILALAISDNAHMNTPAFAIHTDIARRWWIRPFLKRMNAFPMDPTRPLAARSLIRTIQRGSPLVIFPEGRITVTGGLMKVYDGSAMVAERTGSLIIPIKIDGLEKTFFSRLTGIQTRRRLFPKVRVTVTKPVKLEVRSDLPPHARRQIAGNELYQIMSDLVFSTSAKTGTLYSELVNAGKDYGMSNRAVEDPMRGSMRYGMFLTAIRALAKPLHKALGSSDTVGLMLPNSNAAAVAFFALQSAGKITAMMNFSAGLSTLRAAVAAAEIKTIVTSKAFLKQAKLQETADALREDGISFLLLEDVAAGITKTSRLAAFFAKSRPMVPQGDRHNPAVVLFTSGSEGTPKGVVLTHANMLANVAQAAARIDFNRSDKLFNVLPMFHSFGLTAGTVLPLVSGVPVCFYPSPLHYRVIPEVIYSSNATIIFGTDTFLNGYGRNAHPYDLRSIRYCFAGAEPVKDGTRQMMMNKFGIRILEGYGVTETSPVLALNTPMYNKPGTVGKLLPGITPYLEPVEGVETGGRLYVSGPNIMAGYLRVENPGVIDPPPGSRHDTGDIVVIDDEGFVKILGRAKRFAKIGGEMVSLSAVEALAARAFPGVLLGVVSVRDEKKGERIVLVSEDPVVDRAGLLAVARAEGVSELYVPSRIVTGKLPLLGSGKTDYRTLQTTVEGM